MVLSYKNIPYKFIKRRFSITDKHLSKAAHSCSRSILTIFYYNNSKKNYCLTQYYCIFICSDIIKFIKLIINIIKLKN